MNTHPNLILTTAPFSHGAKSTPRVMFDVVAALIPVLLLAAWNFGFAAILIVAVTTVTAVATEWVFTRGRHQSPIRDNSALLTGILLGLTLPSGFPIWMAVLGSFVAIGLGKRIWGGLGQNVFNPALVGRAFLQAAFPMAITTWPKAGAGFWNLPSSLFAVPLLQAPSDTITAATPLGLAKFESTLTATSSLFAGMTGGSIGETSAVLLLICGAYLALRKVFDWRLMVSSILSLVAATALINLIDASVVQTPLFMLTSGGFLFGAVFMVTDPATTPTTKKGAWIFGLGVGALVALIRIYGGLPEGMMYAILLMNAMAPHISRYTQHKQFGGTKRGAQ